MMKEITDFLPGRKLSARQRLFWYIAVWVLAALAFQLFLRPEGLTETNLPEVQQRLSWPFYTPFMVTIGLAEVFTWPQTFNTVALLGSAVCLLVHAVITFTRVYARSFLVMICIQVVLLGIAVFYFVRFSQLPSGG